MKKTYLFFALMAALISGCTKETANDPNELSPELQKVNTLIASAGELQTEATKNDSKILSTVELPGIIPDYSDPQTRSEDTYAARCVETTTHYDMVDNPMEFVTLDPWSNIFPGALVQGKSIAKGIPTIIPIYEKRKPGRISLSIVSGSENMDLWYEETPMRGSDVLQAQNNLMSKFLGSSIPARTSFEIKTVQSIEEMSLKLGINFKLFGAKLGTEFGRNWNKKKSYVAVKLNQLFFTMTYDAPDMGFRGVFTDDIRAWELENYTGFGNPICYVGSVSYGRSFILLYESNYSSEDLETAVNAGYRSYMNTTTQVKLKKVLNESSCKMVQIGGNPEEGLATVFGDFDKLKEFIANATVSKDNVGAPLSYVIYHLKDNSYAQLSNTLDYDVTTKTYHPVEARNDVTIDVLNLQVTPPKPKDKRYKVSNFSYVKIKSIKLFNTNKEDGNLTTSNLATNLKELEQQGNKKGNYIMLSGYKYTQSVPNDRRLRLECLVEVYNEIYHGGTKKEIREVRLTRTFECTPEGQWRATDSNIPTADTFTSIKRSETIADANIDLDLKIRFVQDGVVLE